MAWQSTYVSPRMGSTALRQTATPERIAAQATEDISEKPLERDDILFAAERARAGCWMFFSVVLVAVVTVCVAVAVWIGVIANPRCTVMVYTFELKRQNQSTELVTETLHLIEPVVLTPQMAFS